MAIDIYESLASLHAKLDQLLARLPVPRTTGIAPVTYFRDAALWSAALAEKPALAMINPDNGPGTAASSTYVQQTAAAQSLGVPVYGYTHTRYGVRPVAEVKADIDKHIAWYGVRGIFIDTTSNKPEHVAYYRELCDHVHAKGAKVILNPGTQCLEEHAAMADFVMCSEGDVPTYKARVPRPWESKYPGKLYHAVHGCPAADMPSVVALAKQRGAGLLYVTDDVMPNPWNVLPTYWAAFCASVRS